jgi:hypothetical protein
LNASTIRVQYRAVNAGTVNPRKSEMPEDRETLSREQYAAPVRQSQKEAEEGALAVHHLLLIKRSTINVDA